MKKLIAVAMFVSQCALAVPPREPIDEVVVAKLVKDAMSEAQVRESYDACDSGGPISMKICFRYRFEREMIKLNSIYDHLHESISKHSESDGKALEQAQGAWKKYLELQCSFQGDIGTFDYGVELLACQWELAKLRTATLVGMTEQWNSIDR